MNSQLAHNVAVGAWQRRDMAPYNQIDITPLRDDILALVRKLMVTHAMWAGSTKYLANDGGSATLALHDYFCWLLDFTPVQFLQVLQRAIMFLQYVGNRVRGV